MRWRSALAAAAFAAPIWTIASARAGAQTCSPFGNPPATLIANVIPTCAGGMRLGAWNDADSTPRYACLYEPPQASPSNPLPLVIFLHPSLATADSIHLSTNLLSFLKAANLSDDFNKPGYIALAPEGRNTTHYYADPDKTGPGWDNWYRQFNPAGDVTVLTTLYKENVDAAAIDHFVAAEEATGKVDVNRVFVSGWSNGGAMAYIYGLSRPNIAAVGVYSAPDPFELVLDPCPQRPVITPAADNAHLQLFNLAAPTFQVHSNCDIAGICPNGELLEGQLLLLGGSVSDAIIDSGEAAANGCMASCGANPDGDLTNPRAATLGVRNHVRWPRAWTAALLDFFRRHPLNARL